MTSDVLGTVSVVQLPCILHDGDLYSLDYASYQSCDISIRRHFATYEDLFITPRSVSEPARVSLVAFDFLNLKWHRQIGLHLPSVRT